MLDLSLRNPLLNYRSLRARGVDIVGESAAQVFETLVTERKAMSFLAGETLPLLPEGSDDDDPDEDWWLDYGASQYRANQTDLRLQTSESSVNLEKRLLNTYRLANSSIEETGVNTLFLALGMLQWYEADQSEVMRRAPILLVPVRLERAGVRDRFQVSYTGEDIGRNLSLLEKIRTDFGLHMPGEDESEQVADGTMGVDDYFALFAEKIRRHGPERWEVEPNSAALGFFAYNKIMMYNDLDESAWPYADRLAANEIIGPLYGDGFHYPAPAIPSDAQIDTYLSPQDTYHVLDADSSQSLAIHDALGSGSGGRSFVIQGPPGTGKSQTITNIISEAVARGKRVLFVAEKMAALEVVKRRLDIIGLGDTCLELHSHKTNKRETLDSLSRTLSTRQSAAGFNPAGLDALDQARSQLNAYTDAVNSPVRQSGITPHEAFGQLLTFGPTTKAHGNPISWKEIIGPDPRMDIWSSADFNRKREVVNDLRLRLQRTGVPSRHPFWGCQLRRLLPDGQASLFDQIKAAKRALEILAVSSGAMANDLNLDSPAQSHDFTRRVSALLESAKYVASAPDLGGLNLGASEWLSFPDDITKLVDKGLRWRRIREEHASSLLPQAWDSDLSQVRYVLNTTGRSFFGRLFSSNYRQARQRLAALLTSELPRSLDQQIAMVDAINTERRLRADLSADGPGSESPGATALGTRWAGLDTDWDAVASAVHWWLDLHGEVSADRVSPDVIHALRSLTDANRNEAHLTLPGAKWGQELLGNTDKLFDALKAYVDSVSGLLSALEIEEQKRFSDSDGLLSLSFDEQRRVLSEWDARLVELQDVIGLNNGADAALREGLAQVVTVAERSHDAAESLTAWFERAWYESIVETAFAERPELRDFDGQLQERRIERFKELDRQSLRHNLGRITMVHREGSARVNDLPQRLVRVRASDSEGDGEVDFETESVRRRQQQLRFLQREIAKKSRHRPIRQLIAQAGEVIQELKPVFMMSPLSIATYLPPGSVKFDLIVFDEASQVRPVDAIGALARAQRAIVVGDNKQLPPTSFFDRAVQSDDTDEDTEESVTEGIESILTLFSSMGAPSRQLRWHYRSRHESLIAVSNREFYGNNLVVFPSPDAGRESTGLRWHYLPDTVFDRGRSRTNQLEAEAVARAAMEHAVRNPELSLGVAAFSAGQSQAIQDRLEMLRRLDPSGEEFFAAHPEEPFFVKNLENVQGDERDVIFISIGYGRDGNGQVSMNFGPINSEGGERRLNVLITRAKQQCHVFTNLRSDDIDLDRTKAFGVRALKTFLAYAETGVMPEDLPYESDFEADSPFQREVAMRLEERGYQVHQEVASAGKFVDIGILDPDRPGRYLIGIECDGASYHSSRSARDRDRLREQVLENLGWKLHRVWSTDWFRNPERELKRAVEAIERAKVAHSTE